MLVFIVLREATDKGGKAEKRGVGTNLGTMNIGAPASMDEDHPHLPPLFAMFAGGNWGLGIAWTFESLARRKTRGPTDA